LNSTLNDNVVPRWIGYSKLQTSWKLHYFADGSTRASAAVAYMRVLRGVREYKVTVLTSKTRWRASSLYQSHDYVRLYY